MTKDCTTCGKEATVHGRLAHFCDDCAAAYTARTARAMKIAPSTTQRLINGSRLAKQG